MNIIDIDNEIQEYFSIEEKKISEYKQKILDLQNLLENDESKNLNNSLRQKLSLELCYYTNHVADLEHGETLGFYKTESFDVIEAFTKLLKTSVKTSFFGVRPDQAIQPTTDKINEKNKLVEKYISIIKKYVPSFVYALKTNEKKTDICKNCGSKKIVLVDELFNICIECGCEYEDTVLNLSYKDVNRTNILQKYTYEKRTHFKDALNQYQGKQNCKIDKIIFEKLEEEFEKHYLLIGDKTTSKDIRFKNIKRQHVLLFLKELSFDKQYENVNFIHSEIVGIKCPDITYLEDQLMEDFDVLVSMYNKKFKYERNIERKSFINIQCVFFQLLKKNKYICKKEDFNILKTADRKTFHDEILQELFEELGWNYTPFF